MSDRDSGNRVGRRSFIAGAAAAGITIVKPSLVRGTQANSTVDLGLIGCGGRGNWIIPLFQDTKNGHYRFVACCDYYQDHVDRTGDKLGIPASRRYTTLSGYKRLIDSKLDAVVIETPPYFHPEQAAATVDAGKHVYLAKPIAVDVPGCKSIDASGRKATEMKLVFLVDFQTRADKHYQEAVRRVHEGDIGRLVCGEARYPWGVGNFPGPATPEDRLRRWYCYKALSGDFIIEQNIHTLDVATWFINADPIQAVGIGGSKRLRSYGDIWDHFAVIFTFPSKEGSPFVLSYSGNQATPGAPNEIPCRIYGSRATVDTDYYTHVWIHGDPKSGKPYDSGVFKDLYSTGTANNIRTFYQSIMEGNYSNPTVAPSVRSNLTCVMGRDAAYRGKPITWDELMKSDERLELDLTGLKA
ncbi:MAG TPA: Gfo/Idh/MocA family oxidoreductase [Phycisphaerae bacterium]|jgi:myo-inositol 2-dehydrogenase/D-chiro-inositol 1-dehydrogenase|nr:Gfo/Idh/MocA family oxidoreductase [Phycisphaerae bacterium]HOB73231.1 Gfo/Idh/MocA family oxidoreductase [Phycisphaerae bacterium]HOJ54865.1 Gfo/Idh/MocA family oxidoreductase [Phycisphaerae bacterium]HOL26051.1 Gfo/Idh/MocA family oxidoreductase [Phycisphaerae bacterium]HPP21505.1 Gfo/Idh/MocA family oxidoreductase [Phycisphaerae bacterium]